MALTLEAPLFPPHAETLMGNGHTTIGCPIAQTQSMQNHTLAVAQGMIIHGKNQFEALAFPPEAPMI